MGPVIVVLGILQPRPAFGDLGFGALDFGLITDGIEFVEHLPLFHEIAVLEPDFEQLAGHPRNQLHHRGRKHQAGITARLDVIGFNDLAGRHRRNRALGRSAAGSGVKCAGGQQSKYRKQKKLFFHDDGSFSKQD
ncbi:hypothetical protein SDC9_192222 [bioreactor metagenome]|uniref:Uncharacterized protein n=1 Tax=bioreactor metagenome TaxID=1076179 RepID=A0A645I066_9ZZZZ